MAGISYYNIEQIPGVPQQTKIIVVGTVLAIFKQQKFLTFNISDSTATAQATYYERKLQYEDMNTIPQIGDTIQVLGTCSTKPMANQKVKLFLKVRVDRWRLLDFRQEIQILERIGNVRKKRVQKRMREEIVVLKKKVVVKEKNFSDKEMVDIRSLVLSYLYIVFTSNNDINSYVFFPAMVLKHHLSKQYAKNNQIPQKSLQQAIKRGLNHFLGHEVLQVKQHSHHQALLSNREPYVIKKRYFERLIVQIQQFIFDKKASGVTLQQVTGALNQKLGKYSQQDYMFNFKFIQKVLTDLIHQHRVYKTSDKKLYPNSY